MMMRCRVRVGGWGGNFSNKGQPSVFRLQKKIKCGYSQFIGELYLNKLLDYSIIMKNLHYFVENLNTILSNEYEIDQLENNIICLDKLFKTVKNAMKPEDKTKLLKYLNVFIGNTNMPKRFKFKLMDLKDDIL